ncbi:MAG: Negative regulator of genetic competence ClpC/MecB, partial [uncultured bacterium]
MEFIIWFYQRGVVFYLRRWYFLLASIYHYFSVPVLFATLFSPWRKVVIEERTGYNIQKYFSNLVFNLISRAIGAVMRVLLLISACVLLLLVFMGGAVGLVVWLLLPPLGYSVYTRFQSRPSKLVQKIIASMKLTTDKPIRMVFDNAPGKFVLSRMNLSLDEVVKEANFSFESLGGVKGDSYSQLLEVLVEENTWPDDFFRKRQINKDDLVVAAMWWEQRTNENSYLGDERQNFVGAGIGAELLFGYTPNLSKYSTDMGSPRSYSHRLIGRESELNRMERTLNGGANVMLVGQPGVGKTTVVLAFALKAKVGELGPRLAYKKILELDYNSFLSGTADLNKKKTFMAQILAEAAYSGNTILVIRDIHRLTNPQVEGYDFTDVLEEHIKQEDLKIIAVLSPVDYERFVSQNLRLRKYFEIVEVVPPTKDEAFKILLEAAANWEAKQNIILPIPTLRQILDGSDKYISEIPFPEKALEILDSVVLYKEMQGKRDFMVSIDDVNQVLAEKTGISFARLTEQEKSKLTNIESIIHERLINQEAAVSLIGKSLRGRSVGLKEESRPIGSFLFLGPTGVGKTQTAKVLANIYYGSEANILRFDMAEFGGREGLERLMGSVDNNQPGLLTTAIKNRPASLLLLDEMEKATPSVYNFFLTLLDEGVIT